MTYNDIVKRGWYCKCNHKKPPKTGVDTWNEWTLCSKCRLPIKNSNQAVFPLRAKSS